MESTGCSAYSVALQPVGALGSNSGGNLGMKRFMMPVLFAVALASQGCASSLTSVPVKGKDADVFAMRGDWVGEYSSADTGRLRAFHFAIKRAFPISAGGNAGVLVEIEEGALESNRGEPMLQFLGLLLIAARMRYKNACHASSLRATATGNKRGIEGASRVAAQ